MKPVLEGSEDPRVVLVARDMEMISDAEIVAWANANMAPQALLDDEDYIRLQRTNLRGKNNLGAAQEAKGRLASLVTRHFPDFDLRSSASSDIARGLFLSRLRDCLDGVVDPYEICALVPVIEAKCDYPQWLGTLCDCCDWRPKNLTIDQDGDMRRAIETILAQNSDLQPVKAP